MWNYFLIFLAISSALADKLQDIHEKCATAGIKEIQHNCNNFKSHLQNYYNSEDRIVCENSFKVACTGKMENIDCSSGINAAKTHGDCGKTHSDSFKKCCSACEIGLKFKNAKIECVGSFKTFDRESQEAVLECCKGDDFDYEEPPTTEYNDTTEVPPAPLMSSQILRMGCDDHNICGNDEECFERDGNVDCRCKSGFENFEGKCHDKDECRMGLHNCTKIHKACVNTHGSFLCDKCLDGYEITAFPYDYYESEDLICVDIDECARKSHKCSPDQKCENTEGNYRCVNECAKGFHRVRGECVDIDECETKNPCHFECKNIPGSFECVCPDGYYLDDAGKCTDINECWRTPCGADEVCTNVHGSYRCENISCPTYYKPQEDSKNCKWSKCHGKICHKEIVHVFKSFKAAQRNKIVYLFSANKYETKMNKEYFKITETKSGFAIMLVKPLVHDAEITLTKHEGRFETMIRIFVYVSKYNF